MPKQPKVANLNPGDNVGMGLRGGVKQPNPTAVTPTATPQQTYNPDAPTTKPTKLTQQAGDRLLAPSERQRLSMRGEYVGYGLGRGPAVPLSPQLSKLQSILDFAKKGIYSPAVVQSEVQKAGLQPQFRGLQQVKDFFSAIPGSRMWSNSRQENAQLPQGSAMANSRPLPKVTEVLGDAGLTLDSFRINQPAPAGAPQTTRLTPNMEFNTGLKQTGGFAGDSVPKLDPMVKGLGYQLRTPEQTGLPWPVAGDPKTGEMLTLKGKPLPPLVGPSFPTNSATPAPVPQPAVSSQESVFKRGFEASTGTTESPQKQPFFKRTPELTEGMGLGDRVKFGLGRLAGDVASDATRNFIWRNNHPLAIAGQVFERLAGGNKIGGALSAFTGIQALGQTSNQFDLLNPGQAFRPKGMSAAYPVSDSDKTQIAPGPLGFAKELIGRYALGRNGNLLSYDQFSKERPDVKQEDYQRYSQYLKGGGANGPMPAGTIDVGGFGFLKGNINGINGPEARLAGFSVTPLGAASGTAVATGVASIFNKGLRPTALKGLGVIGTALDFSNRRREGQGIGQAAKGTAVSGSAAFATGQYGAALGARLGPVGAVGGAIVGGVVGAVAGDTAVRAVDAKAQEIRTVQASGKADPVSKFLAATPLGQLAMKSLPGGTDQPEKSAGDAAMSTATDQLLKASANYKLVRQPDGSIKSVRNDTGTAVRGEVVKHSDGDSYELRTYNPETKQFETRNTRLAGADTRETADHDDKPGEGFFNHMTKKQMKEQGFSDKQAVFAQGEKDKKEAERLLPKGSVAYVSATGDSTHGRPVADVRTESGAKDVGETLVKQGNAVEYTGKTGGGKGGKGGNPDGLKIAQLRDGKGGQGDRNNESRERQTTQTNQTKIVTTDLKGRYDNQGKIIQGEYNVKVAQTKGQYDNQGKVITGEYNLKREAVKGDYNVKVAQTKGQYDNQGKIIQGVLKIEDTKERNKGTGYVADKRLEGVKVTAEGKLAGTIYASDSKVKQEGVKQSGAANVADIKAGATMGAAKTAADAKVNVAKIGLEGTQYKADATVKVASITSQAKAEAEGGKAIASYMGNLNKSAADSVEKEERSRIARYKALGVY